MIPQKKSSLTIGPSASEPGQAGTPRNNCPGGGAAAAQLPRISIGKTTIARAEDGALVEIFTMSLGDETIELRPLKNWTQLDTFKWRARCILPRIPAGLEITWNQLKVAGETVSPWDPNACERLEKAFNEWLTLERQSLELAKEKAQAPAAEAVSRAPEEDGVQIKVDLGNAAQPRLKCLEGNHTVKEVALNMQGLNALIEQGIMRKPKTVKVGALHNWVELDGEMFRFKDDPNGAGQLEKALNERYLVVGDPNAPADVIVSANPASPSGFDIQFPASAIGIVEDRKRHLNEETIQLLQNPERCRVLRSNITARFTPPDLVFKVKTAGGGERYLDSGPESTVTVENEEGQAKTIDLSQPISLLNLGVRELNAVFNHPAINRRARFAQIARQNQALSN
ncbi:MAG TPA: hypothetical protein VL793_07320 [Patescibacteria group bacterium]|nr:hypothetical protein [Patescibacteria group bacterium]